MKCIIHFVLLVCLTIHFVVIVYLQSSQLCMPALATAASHPLAVSPREDPHPSLHLSTSPVSCFFYDTPRAGVPTTSFLYPPTTILTPINWVCSPIPCLLAGLPSWPSLGLVACTELEMETLKLAGSFLMWCSAVRQLGVIALCSS